MNLQSVSRKLVVLGFVAALLAGMVSVAGALSIDPRPEIILVGDEEPTGKPGNGMISIGDTIMIRCTVTPNDSVDYITADMRKYGCDEAAMLGAYQGADGYISNVAFVPVCSGEGVGQASMDDIRIVDLRSPSIPTDSWLVCWTGDGDWEVRGTATGFVGSATNGVTFYWEPNPDDTVFAFTITDVADVCCSDGDCGSCDHFEFETHGAIQADTVWTDTCIVADADSFWIDNTPCDYYGHDDPTVLVTAYALGGYTDTLSSYPPENLVGDPVDYDTHWSTYDDPWVRLYATEFDEPIDYFFRFITDVSGNGPIFGETDNILNPANTVFGLGPDTVFVNVDMRKLAHENGNDDILFLVFDAHLLGQAYADSGWWHVDSPYYGSVDCTPPYGDNGVPVDEIFEYPFPILPDTTDVGAGEELPMIWISDSGDTTWFGTHTNRLLAIDNQIPDYVVADSPADSVMPWDITFDAVMDNAGDPDVLNPASEGNPIPDWLQVKIDLAGLFDLDDVHNDTDPGRLFANMKYIGYNLNVNTPFGWDSLAAMHPLSPIWGTDSIDVLASPPSPYGFDQDSIITHVWIFDNAGNTFFVGPWDSMLAVDNGLPFVDVVDCSTDYVIWTELEEDVAFKPDYANVGMPVDNIHGNPYDNRDRIVLHANLGDYFGADEIRDVTLIDNPYCNDPVPILYDNGLDGADAVLGDKNYTGQTRIQVAGITAGVCTLDTDEDEQGFQVLVTDNSGNSAINSSCIQPKVDNEPPSMTAEHVAIMFWDDPETFGVDGDKDGDGIVTIGDELIFEWRAEDEWWDDTEIDSVRVNLASIDPSYTGWLNLWWNPSGGIYRNWWPDAAGGPDTVLYVVQPGTIDGDTLCADFKVWDNAGNTNGWQNFCSDLILDNMGSIIDCAQITIRISGSDTVASAGDTVCFEYAGPDDDVEDIVIHLGDLAGEDSLLALVKNGTWTGCFVVESGATDDPAYYFPVSAEDDVGNEYWCLAGPIAVDNQGPVISCANAYVRLWDYVDTDPRLVSIGDNLTAIFFDTTDDIVRVTADFSNYGTDIGTDGVVDMVFGFDGGPEYKWGYRVDPVPEGAIDQGPGGLGTLVMITAYDDAGNSSSMWFCPIWFDETVLPDPIATPSDTTYMCNSSCVGVDTEPPAAPDPGDITFELLESSNNIANVGDRLRIIVYMGDPTAPGYDMYWENGYVQADIGQYGDPYADLDDYLFLTDRAFSAGGEGDGMFSYHFYYQTADGYWDGQTLTEGAPILPGAAQLPADDPGTRIRVRARDDAGNYSGWVWSDVLVHSETHDPVPVDNVIPEIDPEDITLTFVDNDANGICDIGDSITVTVDMTDTPGGGVAGVWANLYDWGYPSMDKIPLTSSSPVYSISFVAVRNPGNFCEDGVLIEDTACPMVRLLAQPIIHPEVEVMAEDESGNWSDYEWVGPPYVQEFVPEYRPMIEEWPFMPDWSSSGELEHMTADTDAPDPVNPTFGDYWSDVRAYSLVDGSIGIKMFYDKDYRNHDVERFFVYGDIDTAGKIDWNIYLGEPIPVDDIPSSFGGMMARTYVWVSDFLPEREQPYHFAILAVDNANNYSDPELTWVTGDYADATAPTGFVQGFNDADHPADFGDGDSYFLGYLNSDYYEIVYNEWYARIMDIDPMTEGDQPGEWKLIDEDGSWPVFPPYNHIEAPYHCYAAFLDCENDDAGGHPEDCFDLVPGMCYTFEVCVIPWDTEGNHIMPDDAEKFVFTYDNWDPVMTYWAVDGNPSPSAERWVVEDEAFMEARGTDGCDLTAELTWELWLLEVHGSSTEIMLDSQTIPVDETYTFMMDLENYPAGDLTLRLVLIDEVGNAVSYMQYLEVIDKYAPGGRFAFWKEIAIYEGHNSHPEFLKILDGMHVMGGDAVGLTFWVQWPGEVPIEGYDIGEVRVDCWMTGSLGDTTHVATLIDSDDMLTFDGDVWVAYNFEWNTSVFENGDEVTLKATVMDEVGNTETAQVNVLIDSGYPVLTIDIPEAQEVCGEMRVKGAFNITATEVSNPVDTELILVAYKSSDFPDIGDCDPFDSHGWQMPFDSLMWLDKVTPETIWRLTFDPSNEGLSDGSYDFVILTVDVAGNWSWDKNGDWCIDPGYFAEAVANGMGMTVVLQNEAPEVRIRTVATSDHTFGPVDEGWLWPILPYVQCGDQITVASWVESDCDVAKVEYFLSDGDYIIGGKQLVGMSTDPGSGYAGYEVTFPASGDICDYLLPDALQNGHCTVDLQAKLTDVLGNVSWYIIDLTILDVDGACAFITSMQDGRCVGGEVALEATALNNDELYDVTYEYSEDGENWIHIATTRPHDGPPWDTDVNGSTIYWHTYGLSGDYYVRAVSRDANLQYCENPLVIMVTVDNEPPTGSLAFAGDGVISDGEIWLGGDAVIITADVSGGCGIECVTFYYKETQYEFDKKTQIGQPDCMPPFSILWDECADYWNFCDIKSGEYQIIAEIEGKSGVVSYIYETVYVDHWAPEAWITKVEDADDTYETVTPEDPCCCYDVWGVVTFTGWAEDLVPDMPAYVANFAKNSGLNGAQFQYMPYDPGDCDYIQLMSTPQGDWYNLGDPIMDDEGPYYSKDWDTSTLVPGTYAVRVVGIDKLGNRADAGCGQGYEPPFVCINVVDESAPQAVIAGVDEVSGYIWAVPVIHGSANDIAFVRFEFGDGTTWTPIGEVDTGTYYGLYGVPFHTGGKTGQFWVRAVAYDNDYDPVKNPDLYDKDPAMMQITVAADGTVTMAGTAEITGLDRWGNLECCDRIVFSAVSAERPTFIVVYDDDPEDHFNAPWAAWRNDLIRGDDPAVWYDNFDIDWVDPWGNVTIIASYNDEGIVGATTDMVKLYKIAGREGSRGPISQDGMTVDIPAGAFDRLDGLLIIRVPDLIADPSLDDMIPVGHPVMMTFLDYGDCDHHHFENGNRAHLCMDYDTGDIPTGYDEDDLRIAFWDQDSQEWILDGDHIEIVGRTVEDGQVCVYVDQTGTYSVVAAKPLRVTTPIFDPRCNGYTGRHPTFCTIIEDLAYDWIDEIMVVLDGPAGDVIFDDMIIYHGDAGGPVLGSSDEWFSSVSYGAGWFGSYNYVTNRLCMKLIHEDDWSYYWDYWYDYWDWFMFWGDRISDGLPAGDYTLNIYAQNEEGDQEHVTYAFTVDAMAPDVDFVGKYVAANPDFMLEISDGQSGVDQSMVYLDVFAVEPGGSDTENEELLGTATPSAMDFDETEGTVTVYFGDMVYHKTLPHEMSIDVVVYDGEYTSYTGDCSYGECRRYENDHGVPDCADNHANPVWRRFTVDAMPPEMVVTSEESETEVEIKVCDTTSGLDPNGFLIDGVTLGMTDYDWTWTPLSKDCGILRIDVGDGAVDIDVTATDNVGNYTTIEIEKGGTVVDVFDFNVYPVPFDPDKGEYLTIAFTLSKDAHVFIRIYDFAGLPVYTVVDEWMDSGTHSLRWLGTDESGNVVAPGGYIGFVKVDDNVKVITRNLKIAVGGVKK